MKFQNMNSVLTILGKLLLVAAYLTVTLKIDDFIQIQWEEAFWWFWILFALSLALGLITLLMLANNYISIAFGDPPQYSKNELK